MKYPYHDPQWLRQELEKHGSLTGLCKAHNFPESTVISYLRRHPQVKEQLKDLLRQPSLLKGKQPHPRGQIRLASLKRHKQDWSIKELEANNLPLYWNTQWLINQLQELGTLKAVAAKYGYQSTTLCRYVNRQPDLRNTIKGVRKQMYANRVPILVHLPPPLVEKLSRAHTQRDVLVTAIRQRVKGKKEAQNEKSQA